MQNTGLDTNTPARKRGRYGGIALIGVLVSGAALLMIASQIDLALLWEALRGANYIILLPSFALIVIGLAARSVRWRVLLNRSLPLWHSFHILNIAYLVNGLLPLRAGEVARVWLAGRHDVPYLQSATTIVVERLLDLLAVVLFVALGLGLAGDKVPPELSSAGRIMGALALFGFLVLVILSARRTLAHRILNALLARLTFLQRLNLPAFLDHLLDGVKPLSHPLSLANALLWTAISWGFSFASGYVMMFVFYDQADTVTTLLFIAAASFAVALPAVPGNVGPYEGSILLALSAMGYMTNPTATATATAFALCVHFANLAVNAVLGVIGFIAEGVTLGQLSDEVRRMQQEKPAVKSATGG